MDKLIELVMDMARLWDAFWMQYLVGMRNTLILAVAATLIGCVIGFACGVLNTIPYTKQDHAVKRFFLKLVRVVVRVYVEVFRGTPMVLQAVFIFYGLPYFTDQALQFRGYMGMWAASLIIVSINTGAYMAESVRGGILSIDPGQTEGAKAIGMTHVQTMTSVILPQAFRNILPQIGNNFIINIKDTSVMFIIGFTEFFAYHRNIVGDNNMYFPSAAIEMIGYLTMTLIASFLLRLLERRLDGSDSYELVQDDQLVMAAGTYSLPRRGTPLTSAARRPAGADPAGAQARTEQGGAVHERRDFGGPAPLQVLWQPRGAAGHRLYRPPRGRDQHHRRLRLGQVHPAAVHQPAGDPHRRRDRLPRPETSPAEGSTPLRTAPRWAWCSSPSTCSTT